MKRTDEQKQRLLACAASATNTTSALAAAGTLCLYAGASAIDPGVTLLISSACMAELSTAYTQLAVDLPPGDMYTVEDTDPIEMVLPQPGSEFGAVLQDGARHLLLLHLALRNLHLSSVRAQATEAVLERQRGAPAGAEYQDAQLFHTLHRQAIWRNLALCIRFQRELLVSAAHINLLWHHYHLHLPSESKLSEQEVAENFATIWQEQASQIARYQLAAFGIEGFDAALRIIRQKGQLTDPAFLLDEPWHRHLQLLSLSFQHVLDAFYTRPDTPS